jgi:hypothetical protein
MFGKDVGFGKAYFYPGQKSIHIKPIFISRLKVALTHFYGSAMELLFKDK